MDEIETFIRESVAHARTLPLGRCQSHLRTLARVCPDSALIDEVRGIAHDLTNSAQQLELLVESGTPLHQPLVFLVPGAH